MARGTNNDKGSATYLRIADGKIVEEVDKNTIGAVSRTTKPSDEHPEGREVWERRDSYLEGVVTSMWRKEREYKGDINRSLVLRISDVGENCQLEIKEGGRYWSSFMLRLPNMDLTKPIRIAPYDFTDKEGKRVIGLNVFQGDVKVAPKWDKNNPGDLPQGRKVRVNGKDVWDFEERDQYLIKVMEKIAAGLKEKDNAIAATSGEPVASKVDDDNDLPF
jgi:hypothetical protein